MTIRRTLGYGIAAGAAGVTTLNVISYLDMAIRARPSSDTRRRPWSNSRTRRARRSAARATIATTAWPAWGRWPAL
jgi:hypothetical protein